MIEDSAKGGLILMLGQITSNLINALGVIIIARILGSSSYGLISIANIPIRFSLLFIRNGVSNALINFIAEDRHHNNGENLSSIVYSGFLINITIGFVASLMLFLSAGYMANNFFSLPEISQLIRILSITTLAQALLNTSMSVLIGFERMDHRNLVTISFSFLKSLIGPILVYAGLGITGAAIGKSTPIIFAGFLGILLVFLNLRRFHFTTLEAKYFRSIFDYSFPLFISTLFSGMFIEALNFLLPLYVLPSAIGSYHAATNFTVLLSLILVPISNSMFPLLSKLDPNNGVFESVYRNIIKYEAIAAYPVAAIIIISASRMINVLYGPDYFPAISYVRILMLNYFFIGLGSGVNNLIIKSQKRTDIQLKTTLIYLLVGIPMGFYSIPRYGIIGFLFTTIFAPKLGLFYSTIWIRNNLRLTYDYISTFKIAISTSLSYFASIVFFKFFSSNVWLELIFGGSIFLLIYLILILYTKTLTKKNILDIKRITDKNKLGRIIGGIVYNLLLKVKII
jgi:stage V sporulation protein B